VELYLANDPPVTVEPLGIVLKAGSWHLVMGDHGSPSVICLDELRATRLTRQCFEPPPGFSLCGYWIAHLTTVQHS
jgi:hypothetical protein